MAEGLRQASEAVAVFAAAAVFASAVLQRPRYIAALERSFPETPAAATKLEQSLHGAFAGHSGVSGKVLTAGTDRDPTSARNRASSLSPLRAGSPAPSVGPQSSGRQALSVASNANAKRRHTTAVGIASLLIANSGASGVAMDIAKLEAEERRLSKTRGPKNPRATSIAFSDDDDDGNVGPRGRGSLSRRLSSSSSEHVSPTTRRGTVAFDDPPGGAGHSGRSRHSNSRHSVQQSLFDAARERPAPIRAYDDDDDGARMERASPLLSGVVQDASREVRMLGGRNVSELQGRRASKAKEIRRRSSASRRGDAPSFGRLGARHSMNDSSGSSYESDTEVLLEEASREFEVLSDTSVGSDVRNDPDAARAAEKAKKARAKARQKREDAEMPFSVMTSGGELISLGSPAENLALLRRLRVQNTAERQEAARLAAEAAAMKAGDTRSLLAVSRSPGLNDRTTSTVSFHATPAQRRQESRQNAADQETPQSRLQRVVRRSSLFSDADSAPVLPSAERASRGEAVGEAASSLAMSLIAHPAAATIAVTPAACRLCLRRAWITFAAMAPQEARELLVLLGDAALASAAELRQGTSSQDFRRRSTYAAAIAAQGEVAAKERRAAEREAQSSMVPPALSPFVTSPLRTPGSEMALSPAWEDRRGSVPFAGLSPADTGDGEVPDLPELPALSVATPAVSSTFSPPLGSPSPGAGTAKPSPGSMSMTRGLSFDRSGNNIASPLAALSVSADGGSTMSRGKVKRSTIFRDVRPLAGGEKAVSPQTVAYGPSDAVLAAVVTLLDPAATCALTFAALTEACVQWTAMEAASSEVADALPHWHLHPQPQLPIGGVTGGAPFKVTALRVGKQVGGRAAGVVGLPGDSEEDELLDLHQQELEEQRSADAETEGSAKKDSSKAVSKRRPAGVGSVARRTEDILLLDHTCESVFISPLPPLRRLADLETLSGGTATAGSRWKAVKMGALVPSTGACAARPFPATVLDLAWIGAPISAVAFTTAACEIGVASVRPGNDKQRHPVVSKVDSSLQVLCCYRPDIPRRRDAEKAKKRAKGGGAAADAASPEGKAGAAQRKTAHGPSTQLVKGGRADSDSVQWALLAAGDRDGVVSLYRTCTTGVERFQAPEKVAEIALSASSLPAVTPPPIDAVRRQQETSPDGGAEGAANSSRATTPSLRATATAKDLKSLHRELDKSRREQQRNEQGYANGKRIGPGGAPADPAAQADKASTIRTLVPHHEMDLLVVGTFDGAVYVLSVADDAAYGSSDYPLRLRNRVMACGGALGAVSLSPCERVMLCGATSGAVEVWPLQFGVHPSAAVEARAVWAQQRTPATRALLAEASETPVLPSALTTPRSRNSGGGSMIHSKAASRSRHSRSAARPAPSPGKAPAGTSASRGSRAGTASTTATRRTQSTPPIRPLGKTAPGKKPGTPGPAKGGLTVPGQAGAQGSRRGSRRLSAVVVLPPVRVDGAGDDVDSSSNATDSRLPSLTGTFRGAAPAGPIPGLALMDGTVSLPAPRSPSVALADIDGSARVERAKDLFHTRSFMDLETYMQVGAVDGVKDPTMQAYARLFADPNQKYHDDRPSTAQFAAALSKQDATMLEAALGAKGNTQQPPLLRTAARPVALRDPRDAHQHAVCGVVCAMARPQALTVDTHGVLKVWDLRGLVCVQTIPLPCRDARMPPHSIALCGPFEGRALIATKKAVVQLVAAPHGQLQLQSMLAGLDGVRAADVPNAHAQTYGPVVGAFPNALGHVVVVFQSNSVQWFAPTVGASYATLPRAAVEAARRSREHGNAAAAMMGGSMSVTTRVADTPSAAPSKTETPRGRAGSFMDLLDEKAARRRRKTNAAGYHTRLMKKRHEQALAMLLPGGRAVTPPLIARRNGVPVWRGGATKAPVLTAAAMDTAGLRLFIGTASGSVQTLHAVTGAPLRIIHNVFHVSTPGPSATSGSSPGGTKTTGSPRSASPQKGTKKSSPRDSQDSKSPTRARDSVAAGTGVGPGSASYFVGFGAAKPEAGPLCKAVQSLSYLPKAGVIIACEKETGAIATMASMQTAAEGSNADTSGHEAGRDGRPKSSVLAVQTEHGATAVAAVPTGTAGTRAVLFGSSAGALLDEAAAVASVRAAVGRCRADDAAVTADDLAVAFGTSAAAADSVLAAMRGTTATSTAGPTSSAFLTGGGLVTTAGSTAAPSLPQRPVFTGLDGSKTPGSTAGRTAGTTHSGHSGSNVVHSGVGLPVTVPNRRAIVTADTRFTADTGRMTSATLVYVPTMADLAACLGAVGASDAANAIAGSTASLHQLAGRRPTSPSGSGAVSSGRGPRKVQISAPVQAQRQPSAKSRAGQTALEVAGLPPPPAPGLLQVCLAPPPTAAIAAARRRFRAANLARMAAEAQDAPGASSGTNSMPPQTQEAAELQALMAAADGGIAVCIDGDAAFCIDADDDTVLRRGLGAQLPPHIRALGWRVQPPSGDVIAAKKARRAAALRRRRAEERQAKKDGTLLASLSRSRADDSRRTSGRSADDDSSDDGSGTDASVLSEDALTVNGTSSSDDDDDDEGQVPDVMAGAGPEAHAAGASKPRGAQLTALVVVPLEEATVACIGDSDGRIFVYDLTPVVVPSLPCAPPVTGAGITHGLPAKGSGAESPPPVGCRPAPRLLGYRRLCESVAALAVLPRPKPGAVGFTFNRDMNSTGVGGTGSSLPSPVAIDGLDNSMSVSMSKKGVHEIITFSGPHIAVTCTTGTVTAVAAEAFLPAAISTVVPPTPQPLFAPPVRPPPAVKPLAKEQASFSSLTPVAISVSDEPREHDGSTAADDARPFTVVIPKIGAARTPKGDRAPLQNSDTTATTPSRSSPKHLAAGVPAVPAPAAFDNDLLNATSRSLDASVTRSSRRSSRQGSMSPPSARLLSDTSQAPSRRLSTSTRSVRVTVPGEEGDDFSGGEVSRMAEDASPRPPPGPIAGPQRSLLVRRSSISSVGSDTQTSLSPVHSLAASRQARRGSDTVSVVEASRPYAVLAPLPASDTETEPTVRASGASPKRPYVRPVGAGIAKVPVAPARESPAQQPQPSEAIVSLAAEGSRRPSAVDVILEIPAADTLASPTETIRLAGASGPSDVQSTPARLSARGSTPQRADQTSLGSGAALSLSIARGAASLSQSPATDFLSPPLAGLQVVDTGLTFTGLTSTHGDISNIIRGNLSPTSASLSDTAQIAGTAAVLSVASGTLSPANRSTRSSRSNVFADGLAAAIAAVSHDSDDDEADADGEAVQRRGSRTAGSVRHRSVDGPAPMSLGGPSRHGSIEADTLGTASDSLRRDGKAETQDGPAAAEAVRHSITAQRDEEEDADDEGGEDDEEEVEEGFSRGGSKKTSSSDDILNKNMSLRAGVALGSSSSEEDALGDAIRGLGDAVLSGSSSAAGDPPQDAGTAGRQVTEPYVEGGRKGPSAATVGGGLIEVSSGESHPAGDGLVRPSLSFGEVEVADSEDETTSPVHPKKRALFPCSSTTTATTDGSFAAPSVGSSMRPTPAMLRQASTHLGNVSSGRLPPRRYPKTPSQASLGPLMSTSTVRSAQSPVMAPAGLGSIAGASNASIALVPSAIGSSVFGVSSGASFTVQGGAGAVAPPIPSPSDPAVIVADAAPPQLSIQSTPVRHLAPSDTTSASMPKYKGAPEHRLVTDSDSGLRPGGPPSRRESNLSQLVPLPPALQMHASLTQSGQSPTPSPHGADQCSAELDTPSGQDSKSVFVQSSAGTPPSSGPALVQRLEAPISPPVAAPVIDEESIVAVLSMDPERSAVIDDRGAIPEEGSLKDKARPVQLLEEPATASPPSTAAPTPSHVVLGPRPGSGVSGVGASIGTAALQGSPDKASALAAVAAAAAMERSPTMSVGTSALGTTAAGDARDVLDTPAFSRHGSGQSVTIPRPVRGAPAGGATVSTALDVPKLGPVKVPRPALTAEAVSEKATESLERKASVPTSPLLSPESVVVHRDGGVAGHPRGTTPLGRHRRRREQQRQQELHRLELKEEEEMVLDPRGYRERQERERRAMLELERPDHITNNSHEGKTEDLDVNEESVTLSSVDFLTKAGEEEAERKAAAEKRPPSTLGEEIGLSRGAAAKSTKAVGAGLLAPTLAERSRQQRRAQIAVQGSGPPPAMSPTQRQGTPATAGAAPPPVVVPTLAPVPEHGRGRTVDDEAALTALQAVCPAVPWATIHRKGRTAPAALPHRVTPSGIPIFYNIDRYAACARVTPPDTPEDRSPADSDTDAEAKKSKEELRPKKLRRRRKNKDEHQGSRLATPSVQRQARAVTPQGISPRRTAIPLRKVPRRGSSDKAPPTPLAVRDAALGSDHSSDFTTATDSDTETAERSRRLSGTLGVSQSRRPPGTPSLRAGSPWAQPAPEPEESRTAKHSAPVSPQRPVPPRVAIQRMEMEKQRRQREAEARSKAEAVGVASAGSNGTSEKPRPVVKPAGPKYLNLTGPEAAQGMRCVDARFSAKSVVKGQTLVAQERRAKREEERRAFEDAMASAGDEAAAKAIARKKMEAEARRKSSVAQKDRRKSQAPAVVNDMLGEKKARKKGKDNDDDESEDEYVAPERDVSMLGVVRSRPLPYQMHAALKYAEAAVKAGVKALEAPVPDTSALVNAVREQSKQFAVQSLPDLPPPSNHPAVLRTKAEEKKLDTRLYGLYSGPPDGQPVPGIGVARELFTGQRSPTAQQSPRDSPRPHLAIAAQPDDPTHTGPPSARSGHSLPGAHTERSDGGQSAGVSGHVTPQAKARRSFVAFEMDQPETGRQHGAGGPGHRHSTATNNDPRMDPRRSTQQEHGPVLSPRPWSVTDDDVSWTMPRSSGVSVTDEAIPPGMAPGVIPGAASLGSPHSGPGGVDPRAARGSGVVGPRSSVGGASPQQRTPLADAVANRSTARRFVTTPTAAVSPALPRSQPRPQPATSVPRHVQRALDLQPRRAATPGAGHNRQAVPRRAATPGLR